MAKYVFAFFLCFTTITLFAQEGGTDRVEVHVVDGDIGLPLEGARLSLWNGREVVCGEDGSARFDVPAGQSVIVRISYPGYESLRLVIRPGTTAYRAALRLGGTLEGRAFVVEAPRPGASETVSGRSVAISGRDLTTTAETGIIGDVMNSVKLLPGVGYVGGYMAMPSIRGGEPSDITAVFDGFYVERPYHWGGAFSIFDPKMVESAQLSHGVFSARYGHTISGLLDIRAKHPSPETAELELAVSSSATNLNLSFPLGENGAAAIMGKVTYWDPFIEAAKLFVKEVRYVTTAPYIRSGALAGSYRFSTDLSLAVNGFFGGDGIGVLYDESDPETDLAMKFLFDNKIGFLTGGLTWTPGPKTVIKGRLGAGLIQTDLDGRIDSEDRKTAGVVQTRNLSYLLSDRTVNVQGRFDLDHDFGGGFLFAAGLEERYSRWDRNTFMENSRNRIPPLPPPPGTPVIQRYSFSNTLLNQGLTSSLYSLFEWKSPGGKFAMELGLRGDHFLLAGDDFIVPGIPAVNPRINFDFGIVEDYGVIDKASWTIGTGLFSSTNAVLQNVSGGVGTGADTLNRAWTSVAGTKIDFSFGWTWTLEAYFKYVFNRAYTQNVNNDIGNVRQSTINYFFDGEAIIWGFDTMIQKFSARYWDGWISYSFINANYRDPQSPSRERNSGGWYYPDFHRFHTLNLIVNYKPVKTVQLTTRFGIASGIPVLKTLEIRRDPNDPSRYERIRGYDANSRMGPALPLDVKFSLFSFNKNGKARREIYLSFENLLSLVYKPEAEKGFDSETGKETEGNGIASYDLPIPLITFGIKWSF